MQNLEAVETRSVAFQPMGGFGAGVGGFASGPIGVGRRRALTVRTGLARVVLSPEYRQLLRATNGGFSVV